MALNLNKLLIFSSLYIYHSHMYIIIYQKLYINEYMSSTKMEVYIQGQSSIFQCKDDILKRMNTIKKKIDVIEQGQRQHQQTQMALFLNKFKKDLKFILNQFQQFHKVLDKINKELYEKHQLSKQLIVNTIRQQMKRFHHLIPKHIQQEVQSSKIKGPMIRSKILEESINENDNQNIGKQQTIQTEKTINSITKQKQEQEDQFQQLISNLNGFLVQSTIEQDKQKQQTQLPQNQAQTSFVMQKQGSIEQQQQLEERKRYRTYIQKENKRQARKPFKIAGGILCALLSMIVTIATLIFFAIYKMFNSFMQDF